MKIDLVKQLINEFENSEVFKMKVEIDDIKLELEKAPAAPVNVVNSEAAVLPVSSTPVSSTSAPLEAVKEPAITGTPIKSPIVGVYYAASSPTAKPYVEVGSKVKAGQVLCIVVKVMNEIKSPIDGTVSAIMAETEDLVEYDQVLMVIEG